jgi:homoserine kinase
MHQPQRANIMPALMPCIKAALAAGKHSHEYSAKIDSFNESQSCVGAKGAFLSGAGSSIMAITAGRKGDV